MVAVADKYFADIFFFAFIDIGADRTRRGSGCRVYRGRRASFVEGGRRADLLLEGGKRQLAGGGGAVRRPTAGGTRDPGTAR